jgi:hypothetical protein
VIAPTGFLTVGAGKANLNIPFGQEFVATIADGNSNYLVTERLSIQGAWTGITTNTDRWLYIDLDMVTGKRTFGSTAVEPITSPTAPTSPVNDQHWFDTTTNTMRVFITLANRWARKVRVFVAVARGGTVIRSMSINAPIFTGTQIGNNSAIEAGALLYDDTGTAIKKSTGEFFTTIDSAAAIDGSNAQVKLSSQVVLATATTNIPAYSVIKFSDFGEVELGVSYVVGTGKYGFSEGAAAIGELVQVLVDGVIYNPAWDWSAAEVGDPLYVNTGGQLSLTPVTSPDAIASVLTPQSILLRSSALYGLRTISDGELPGASMTTELPPTGTPGAILQKLSNGVRWTTEVDGGNVSGTVTYPSTSWPPAVVSVTSDSGDEGTPLVHTVTLTMAGDDATVHSFLLGGGTAVVPTDYTLPPTFSNGVTFTNNGTAISVPAGVSTFTVTIATVTDGVEDGEKTYNLTVGGIVGVGTIIDVDATGPVLDSPDFIFTTSNPIDMSSPNFEF